MIIIFIITMMGVTLKNQLFSYYCQFCFTAAIIKVSGTLQLQSPSWRNGQIIPNLPNIQGYLFQTMARINPAIEELELGSMLPSMPFSDKDVNNVKFYLYTGDKTDIDSESIESSETEEQLLVNDLSSVESSTYNPNYDVKILIHGWSMSLKSKDFPGPVKNAYLEMANKASTTTSEGINKKYNIVCVDWSALSREFLYFNSVLYAAKVGSRIGEFITFLKLGGFISNYEAVHMVGFSLGAHVAAIAGNFVYKATNGKSKVGRITGLDPAGPGFSSEMPLSQRLDPSDAHFVDVIHTNMGHLIKGEFGTTQTSGHCDFYPNGGHRQPGCELSLLREYSVPRRSGCNHMKAIDYFTLSIEVPYLACKCKNWSTYLAGQCNCTAKENRAYMGEHCDVRARGKYYLHAH